jgi:glucosamine--fructose-6-phosphate aminotransferase (isomerizing)
MRAEIAEGPRAVERQAAALRAPLDELVRALDARPPRVVVTCARGSSAHAAAFGKHLIERYLGIPVSPAAPSIATVYGRRMNLEGQLFLAVSQSGQSHDLVEQAASAKAAGALVVALVNDPESPLARGSDVLLPMEAGPEISVAATKTFIASLSALLALTARWSGEPAMGEALARLPERLDRAVARDWSPALARIDAAESLVTIGRGPTLAIAREAALKLKETCHLHAEAFSGAEFMHGPVALVQDAFPVLMFMPNDEATPGLERLAADLAAKEARVLVAGPGAGAGHRLPVAEPDFPEADAVGLVASFYRLAADLAQARGVDPDNPRHLNKVTRTR